MFQKLRHMRISAQALFRKVINGGLLLVILAGTYSKAEEAQHFYRWALKPPMGWNSWDCFGTTVAESQVREQAEFIAKQLAKYGWEYVVVDIQWYEPFARGHEYRPNAELVMDQWGRLLPATNRFPSAAGGAGFRPLADYVHSLGLKFGIHLMRGIPRQAVRDNTPILGTPYHARDIANTNDRCPWNPDMYGVDMTKPGAQEYYNSVFDLIASWGVDFVKIDDIARPYHTNEIEAIRRAIDRTGRPIVLSLSPGATPLGAGEHVMRHANMWRISDDFWDRWSELYAQFERLHNWSPYRGDGHFPDADMLPLGVIAFGRKTRFTPEEQYTLMTLWCIARSPLIYGGDLTKMDPFTLSLLTNEEVLRVNQLSYDNRQLFRSNDVVAWVARDRETQAIYLAVFNIRDPKEPDDPSGVQVEILLEEYSFPNPCKVRDLWQKKDIGLITNKIVVKIPYHGSILYRLTK